MTGLIPLFVVVVAYLAFRFYRKWRLQTLRAKPLPANWQAMLDTSFAPYRALTGEEQQKLHQLMQLFLADKQFYGCAGLTITDQMRVLIAAQACLLVLNQGGSVYPKLTAILVYPSAFKVDREQPQENGTIADGEHHLLGESWGNGRVILSWDDVESGVVDFNDGHNVTLHEFAHQLDAESGSTNGAPPLRRNSYKTWASVFSDNFDDLRARSLNQHKTVIDEYGTTNPAEFFAVATETFFEKPEQLYARRPELYEELSLYYQVDPRKWVQ